MLQMSHLPHIGRCFGECGRTWLRVARFPATTGEALTNSGQDGAKFGRFWAKPGQFRPNVAHNLTDFGPNVANISPHILDSGLIRPTRRPAKFDRLIYERACKTILSRRRPVRLNTKVESQGCKAQRPLC